MNAYKINLLEARFKKEFGLKPSLLLHAPGRVNLIGEHTDYNAGMSLPCAIDFGLKIGISLRDDEQLHLISDIDGQLVKSELSKKPSKDCWTLYPHGLALEFKEISPQFKGYNLMVESNLPVGSGLSSSAALLCGVAQALKNLLKVELNDLELCKLVQKVELKYLGKKTGLMDQMAICLSKEGSAVFIDFKDMSHQLIELPSKLNLTIFHTGIHRKLSGSEYNQRVDSCQSACQTLEIDSLRDLQVEDLSSVQKKLDQITFKRVRHVVTENHRVQQFVEAVNRGICSQLFHLIQSSHQSLSKDYEVSGIEIDCLTGLIQNTLGEQGGVRLTGGGFGGCLVALSTLESLDEAWPDLKKRYKQQTGLDAKMWSCQSVDGLSRGVYQ